MIASMHEPVVGVLIDSEGATLVHWREGDIRIERLESDIPAHHRSVGHVREGRGQHGGTGARSAGESPRLEHRRAFIEQVVAALAEHDLLILGPSQMPGALARAVERADRHAVGERDRHIEVRPVDQLTEPQLVAITAEFAGAPSRRQLPGGRQTDSSFPGEGS